LPSGIFDKLTALTTLALNNTNLSTLPAGLFDGLTGLTNLTLHGNAVDPLPLTVSLERVRSNQFKAVAPTGAPFEIVLPLIVANGTINGGATTITIPKGRVESALLTVTRTPGSTFGVTANIGAPLPARPVSHTGYMLVKSDELPLGFPALGGAVFTPVSERTAQVRDAIVDAVPGINSANDVTAVHVAAIHTLSLASQSITTLKAGDFDGFTALATLTLNNNALSTLPAGIFDELTALTTLALTARPE
jgi:Leucine-rich repeat (LRR) protein